MRTRRRGLLQLELEAIRRVLTPERLEKVKSWIENRVESIKNQ